MNFSKLLVFCGCLCFVLFCGGYAQTDGLGSTYDKKISVSVAYIDIGMVTEKAKPVHDMISKLEPQLRAKQDEIERKSSELDSLESEYRSKSTVLTEQRKKELKELIIKARDEIRKIERELQEKFRKHDEQVIQPILKLILHTIEQIATERRIDIVLRQENVLFAAKSLDITGDVIVRINADYLRGKPNEATEDAYVD